MTGWQSRYTSPGATLDREIAAKSPMNLLVPNGKQFCEAGKHYVKRVGNTTKGWKCPACEAKGN